MQVQRNGQSHALIHVKHVASAATAIKKNMARVPKLLGCGSRVIQKPFPLKIARCPYSSRHLWVDAM